jgi:hypothetical protein
VDASFVTTNAKRLRGDHAQMTRQSAMTIRRKVITLRRVGERLPKIQLFSLFHALLGSADL